MLSGQGAELLDHLAFIEHGGRIQAAEEITFP